MSSIASRTTQGIVPPSPFRSIPRFATHYIFAGRTGV